ncbi:hypothetical protein M436DRAFT_54001 [Aureobasidium namibiae CBS 147.97]|uniref:Uncharacterized protein n=1 Tax=Aureobasidium namibiae CBS 147.97 TaxID=1043004 RepID=A0A074WAU1_9PEZI
MHIIAYNPFAGASRNLTFDDNNESPFSSNSTNDTANKLPWYMGEWTTPVSVVLYVYSLISFMIFLLMFMLYVSRHGCFHICRCRRRRRAIRYQQQRVRVWNEQQTNMNHHGEDSDEEADDLETNSVLHRGPAAVNSENGGHRVHNIQRLERALRTAGMA